MLESLSGETGPVPVILYTGIAGLVAVRGRSKRDQTRVLRGQWVI